MPTTTCIMTIFGKPLAAMTKANADCLRFHLADLTSCPCDDCKDAIARRGF